MDINPVQTTPQTVVQAQLIKKANDLVAQEALALVEAATQQMPQPVQAGQPGGLVNTFA